MALSDWLKNTNLRFNSDACISMIKNIIDTYLDDLSKHLVDIVRGEIWLNGNGSYQVMRLFTAALVKETKREITDDHILLEVGIMTQDLPEDAFVRVAVVLHGNQGGGVLTTKPGQMTWSKHVISKRPSTAKSVYNLPDEFNQGEALEDIVKNIDENINAQFSKYVNSFVHNVKTALRSINLSAFLEG